MGDSVVARLEVTTRDVTRVVDLSSYLKPSDSERATIEAFNWIKSLRHTAVDDVLLRDRFTHRGDSLWWFLELFLAKERGVVAAFKTLAALERLIEDDTPQALSVVSGDNITRTIVDALAIRHAWARTSRSFTEDLGTYARRMQSTGFHLAETVRDRLLSSPKGAQECDVAMFVHSAFWRSASRTRPDGDSDVYVGTVLDELERCAPALHIQLVGIGPRTSFQAKDRRSRSPSVDQAESVPFAEIVRYASWRSVLPSLGVWGRRHAIRRALLRSDAIRSAATVHQCDLWPILRDALAGAALLQLPWAARAMDEIGAALDVLQPRVAVTYAEAGSWGRALVLEGRRRGIPVVGIQHGFIYRHWLNYQHEPDEMEPSDENPADTGFPRPERTLVFDRYADESLQQAGNFPKSALTVVGSPARDALARAAHELSPESIAATRAAIGASPNQQVVLVTTKYSEIGSEFQRLVDAVAALPGVYAVIKCHPAENSVLYEIHTHGVTNITVLPSTYDLSRLLAIARLLVTVNSTVAFDAMSLGVPSLTLRLPNNLSPLVEAGAMAGLLTTDPIGPALEPLLYDETRRSALAAGARDFLTRYDIRADGLAARRMAEAIAALVPR